MSHPVYTYFYRIFAGELNISLPDSAFEAGVLIVMNVAPSHLHPNGLGFVRNFEILCRALGISVTPSLFYCFHKTQRVEKVTWVSVTGILKRCLFSRFSNLLTNWNDKLFRIHPYDSRSEMFVDALGVHKFPLCWASDLATISCFIADRFSSQDKKNLSLLEGLFVM